MGGFRVDLEALARLAGDVDGAREQLDGALRALDEAPQGGLGTDELDHACGEFRASWGHGVARLGECTVQVRDAVELTRARYAAADAAVVEGLR